MLVGILHKGSGLGDQLFSYIATRVRAADLGVDFGFVGKEFFKGSSFMNLDFGKEVNLEYHIEEPSGKLTIAELQYPLVELNTPYYNPEFNFIPDFTFIDGYGAQDIRYFEHRLDEVRSWIKVEVLEVPEDVCIINVRGGEFRTVLELILPSSYWWKAIEKMATKYPSIKFKVHSDDPEYCKELFGNQYPIIKDISKNWRSITFAGKLILSNSAFGIIPSLLGTAETIYAPRYWNRYNLKRWDWPGNYYKRFIYLD